MKRFLTTFAGLILLVVLAATAQAVEIETVPVGNIGNLADDEVMVDGTTGYGAVDYAYNIGKYEVTSGQYCEFLNAVANTDTYGLYHPNMYSESGGCKIRQTGTSGNFQYLVDADGDDSEDADWTKRPVSYVSWSDAARFCNWLHNGQPTGLQDLTTTEDGAYHLNGAVSIVDLMAVSREADWKWSIPSEDEWYKAAYHDKNAGLAAAYFDYPTSSDSVPGYVNGSGNLSGSGDPFMEGGTDPGNYATYDGDNGTSGIGSPYYCTEVGEWENSDSPYGTFDQGGNVWEWNDAAVTDSSRGVRSGLWYSEPDFMAAYYRIDRSPAYEYLSIGFRVVQVPEPSTITLLVFGLTSLLCWRRCK